MKKLINFIVISLFFISLVVDATEELNQLIDKQMNPSKALYMKYKGDILALLKDARAKEQAIVIAHRGGIAPGFPENSNLAFRRVTASAPVILELDIMATSDGINMVHHDSELDRTTTGKGKFAEHTFQEIKALKLRDQSNRIIEEEVLKFDDFLKEFSGNTFLMLDMKSPSNDREIVEAVMAHDMLQSTIFIAYSLKQAIKIRAANPNTILALGVPDTNKITAIAKYNLATKPYIALMGNIQQSVEQFQQPELKEHFITVGSYLGDNPTDAQLEVSDQTLQLTKSLNAGVSMIVSNQPIAMYRALSKQGKTVLFSN